MTGTMSLQAAEQEELGIVLSYITFSNSQAVRWLQHRRRGAEAYQRRVGRGELGTLFESFVTFLVDAQDRTHTPVHHHTHHVMKT